MPACPVQQCACHACRHARATHVPPTHPHHVAHTLHCAITSSGVDTMKSGAPIIGALREPKSLAVVADEARLRALTPERIKSPQQVL